MSKESKIQKEIEAFKGLAGAIAREARSAMISINDCYSIAKDNLEEIKKFMNHAESCTKRNLSIIDMLLLNLHEEEIDPKGFANLSIAKMVDTAIKEYGFEDENQKSLVTVNIENDFKFKGDETLMIYVIFNLLRNALYYKANINIWTGGKGSRQLYFKDDGPVLPLEQQRSIFNTYYNPSRHDSNSFGLLFCSRVIEAFGGKISCNSIGGKYTVFILEF